MADQDDDQDDADRFLRHVLRNFGYVSIPVYAADLVVQSPTETLSSGEPSAVSHTKPLRTFNLCRSLADPRLHSRKDGVIVNTSSIADRNDDQVAPARCSASNAGIKGTVLALAKEVAQHGVRVNIIAPGYVDESRAAKTEKPALPTSLSSLPLTQFGHGSEVSV